MISKNAFRRPGDAVAFAREGISRARDASRCAVVCCVLYGCYNAPRRCYSLLISASAASPTALSLSAQHVTAL